MSSIPHDSLSQVHAEGLQHAVEKVRDSQLERHEVPAMGATKCSGVQMFKHCSSKP